MSLAFYKPNKSKSGHAFSFKLHSFDGETEPTFLMEGIKQKGEMGKPGTFKGGQQITVKLNVVELGTVLDGIEQDFATKISLFHKSEKGSSSISFYKAEIPGDKGPRIIYSVGIIRGEAKFSIGLSRGDIITLREYLKWAMRKMFEAAAKVQRAAMKPKTDE